MQVPGEPEPGNGANGMQVPGEPDSGGVTRRSGRSDTTADAVRKSPKTVVWSPEEEARLEAEVSRLRMELDAVTQESEELQSKLHKRHVQEETSQGSSEAAGSPYKGLEDGRMQVTFPDEVTVGGTVSLPSGATSRKLLASGSRSDREGGDDSPGGFNALRRPRSNTHQSAQMVREAQQLDEVLREADSDGEPDTRSVGGADIVPSMKNFQHLSALTSYKVVQGIIYLIAIGGLVFVLVAKSTDLGADDHHDDHGDSHGDSHGDDHHDNHGVGDHGYSNESSTTPVDNHHGSDDHHRLLRRLGSGPTLLATNMAYCVGSFGLIAFFFNLRRQPLVVAYISAGVMMGSRWGLGVVENVEEIQDLRSLGLIFLCFMIGLEMDLSEIFRMGRPVVVAGFVQFPLTAGILGVILIVLYNWGMPLGDGEYAVLYCSITCAFTSRTLVVKRLTEQAEMDTSPGRMTSGILFFQDMWAIVLLAVQPELGNPKDVEVLRTAGMIVAVSVVALLYAKFVMPSVYRASSSSVELMLVMSLAWCFFICCLSTLPLVELSMELAALIAGVALATFPYSMEFNSKIKYIKDFFITFYFAGLGMQLPFPSLVDLGTAVALSAIILLVRWIGIFVVILAVGSTERVGALATINLSNLGEFALVICSVGLQYNHINTGTLKIILWTFIFLLILSNMVIRRNYRAYALLSRLVRHARVQRNSKGETDTLSDDDDNNNTTWQQDRTIILLGFHKIAAMLLAHWEHHNRALLSKVHVIDFHEDIASQLTRGVTCSFGDISSPEEVQRLHPYEAHLVICSIPDAMLRGITNQQLLMVANRVWPKADVIVTADNQSQVHILYEAGADYVLRMAKLCAERLHELIVEHSTHAVHHPHHPDQAHTASGRLNIFEVHRKNEGAT